MSQNIPAVQHGSLKHAMLIDLEVNGVSYYISNAYAPLTYLGNTYTQLGHFLGISELQDDLKTTNNQITLSLSGLPSDDGGPNYMGVVLNSGIKGSKIIIYRAFYDINSGNFTATQVYQRFNGYVSNFNLSENFDVTNRTLGNNISIQCSSIHALIEKRYTGRRTNDQDQQFYYPGDIGMYRVKSLSDAQFDFGKPA